MEFEKLQERRKQLKGNSDITLENMQILADESRRVENVAHNSSQILDDLDAEFESWMVVQGYERTKKII